MLDNLLIYQYRLILLICPLSALLVVIQSADFLSKWQTVKQSINGQFHKSGIPTVKKLLVSSPILINYRQFQLIRVIGSLVVTMALKPSSVFIGFFIFLVIYSAFYLYLILIMDVKKKQLRMKLPYCLKSIVYLCYIYPVANALSKAIDYIPEEFVGSLQEFVYAIDQHPSSFQPYQNFIQPFAKQMPSLNMYMRILYRMAQSGGSEADHLLSSINQSISDEINLVRLQKNKNINNMIQYLGLIPVGLVTFMLGYLLIFVSGKI
ncbi:MAG: hypothetical protein VB012_05755 [Erysipelotrichaceae bacterium]|nr:hypothetical protein [Erysipelotrichaceae bacterium]